MARTKHIQELIEANTNRLYILQLQKARDGNSVDPKIIIEIRAIKEEITNLEAKLGEANSLKSKQLKEITSLNDELNKANSLKANHQEEITRLNTDLKKANSLKANHLKEITSLNTELKKANILNADHLKEITSLKANHLKEITRLKADLKTTTIIPPPSPLILKAGSTKIREADGMTMLYVPGGKFRMGSDTQADDEKPQHPVTVDSFWIDKTTVTVAMFRAFVEVTGYKTACEEKEFKKRNNKPDHPVVEVTWHDARAYCEWVGGRLPTEAEWEYAARGKDGRIYPWGDTFDMVKLNCGENKGYSGTTPVGNFLSGKSWVGALDMSGNVWEWTQSTYKDYPYKADDGREDTKETVVTNVLRGGSWGYFSRGLRAADRYIYIGNFRNAYIWFRCVEVVP